VKDDPVFQVLQDEVPGAKDLLDWFGYWPTFHDAEIVSLSLNRHGESVLTVHTWHMTSRVDDKGFYVLERHVVVSLYFSQIVDLELTGFSQQNVVSSIAFQKEDAGYRVSLGGCYGLSGWILARQVRLGITPGQPQ
jgi:Immunity protein 50